MVSLELLFYSDDSFKHCAEQILSLYLLLRVETVVTVAAVVLSVLLSKVVEQ